MLQKSLSNAMCTGRHCCCLLLCLIKHDVRSLVLLLYLLGQLGVECWVGEAPYHSAYFAAAFLCSQFFCFLNTVCSCSSLHFLTPPFLLQLWFANANENNQQTPFMWPVHLVSCCLPSCTFPLFLLGVNVSLARKGRAVVKSALSWEWME